MSRNVSNLFEGGSFLQSVLPKALFSEEGADNHLPFVSARGDQFILTRQGDLLASAVIGGLDSFTAETSEIAALTEGFSRLVGQLGEQFAYYVNKITLPGVIDLTEIDEDGLAAEIDRRWRQTIQKRQLKQRVLLLSVAMRPGLAQKFSLGGKIDVGFVPDLAMRKERLEEAMGLLSAMYSNVGYERLSLSGGKWLGLLGAIHGQEYQKKYAMPGQFLAPAMTNADYLFKGKRFRIDDGHRRRYGAIFGIKAYAPQTLPVVLDALELPYDIVITNSFTPIRNNEAEEKIRRTARQMAAADDAAVSLREGLYEAADEVSSGRVVFGKHQLTVMVTAATEKDLDIAASEVWRAGQESGATLVRESFASRAMFYSQAPGNFKYRARAQMVSSKNFSDFAAFHSVSPGRPNDQSPWGSSITLFPTVSSCQYRLNFHERGSTTSEPSSGHTLVLGRPGSGKTLGTAFLCAQARRVGARLIVFDKDHGLEMAVRGLGGSYSSIRIGQATGLNPFMTETDDRGAAWLTDWVSDILSRKKSDLDTKQTVAVTEAIKRIVKAEPALRTFSGLASIVNQTDDGGDLVSRVREWTASGRFGWLFDQQAEQSIEIGEDVIGLDMSEILDLETERSAILAYLFRRVERVIEDRKPTIIVIDEAWKMLNDDMFVTRLHDWLVTMRKKNCVVMMLTQTPGHLAESRVGSIIAEMVSTQILFPNPSASPDEYKILRLNERESAFVSQSTGGMRLSLVRSAGESLFINMDLSGLGELVTVLGGGKRGEDRAPYQWRNNPEFWREMR